MSKTSNPKSSWTSLYQVFQYSNIFVVVSSIQVRFMSFSHRRFINSLNSGWLTTKSATPNYANTNILKEIFLAQELTQYKMDVIWKKQFLLSLKGSNIMEIAFIRLIQYVMNVARNRNPVFRENCCNLHICLYVLYTEVTLIKSRTSHCNLWSTLWISV